MEKVNIYLQTFEDNMAGIKDLMKSHPKIGKVDWISIRPQRISAVQSVDEVLAKEGIGLEGDHYKSMFGTRQVTLIQAEHLDAVASFLGVEKIDPALTRRNLVISGINLNAFKGEEFQIGEAILKYSGECHPCSRIEENLGAGGYNAMRGHGGITAKIIKSGLIRVGDSVSPVSK